MAKPPYYPKSGLNEKPTTIFTYPGLKSFDTAGKSKGVYDFGMDSSDYLEDHPSSDQKKPDTVNVIIFK